MNFQTLVNKCKLVQSISGNKGTELEEEIKDVIYNMRGDNISTIFQEAQLLSEGEIFSQIMDALTECIIEDHLTE